MHMMIGLETLGTHPGAVILSIGACIFDPFASRHGNAGMPVFYCNVSRASCEEFGLTADPKTEAWWNDQGDGAKAGLLTNQLPLERALANFAEFWTETHAKEVWSYGANFDVVLMEEAMRNVAAYYRARAPEGKSPSFEIVPPWSYKHVRCVRTILALAGVGLSTFKRVGVHHNALDDARTQANAVVEALARMRVSASINEMASRTSAAQSEKTDV